MTLTANPHTPVPERDEPAALPSRRERRRAQVSKAVLWRPRGEAFGHALAAARPQRVGKVSTVVGLSVEVTGLDCAVGDLVSLGAPGAEVDAEVVAATRDGVRCMPFGRLAGLTAGDRLVGIISHVAELKERIDKQIVVTKSRDGYSSARIVLE